MFKLFAHFLKSGVVFVLDLVSLVRYYGVIGQKAWAWIHLLVKNNRGADLLRWFSIGAWTMKMVEGSFILFYGCAYILLERFLNPGTYCSVTNLQHVLIAFIFIGCGLLGVLLERKLASWRNARVLEPLQRG